MIWASKLSHIGTGQYLDGEGFQIEMKQVKWNDRITELNFSFHEISFVRYYQPPTKKTSRNMDIQANYLL